MANEITQEQLENGSETLQTAVFSFYEGYTETYSAAIEAGTNNQQAAIEALEAAHRAASQAFTDAYTAAISMPNGSAMASAYADAALASLERANALLNDTRIAETILTEYIQGAAFDFNAIVGDNPFLKAIGQNAGTAGDILEVAGALTEGASETAKAIAGIALGTLGTILGGAIAGVLGLSAIPTGLAIAAGALIGGNAPDTIIEWLKQYVLDDHTLFRMFDTINDLFNQARTWIRRDPLALDLDGDGIETVGASSTILFDHDGDGIQNGTGWIKADDGLLVLDRNGNGSIDNGAELFGVDTLKSDGQLALDGFDALRDLDSNADGVFDANDAQFANIQVWRDLNQDGASQANELFSLAALNIIGIDLTPTIQTVNVGNGNLQTASARFTYSDGSTGKIANLNLVDNPFYREFADSVPLTEQAQNLPDLQGSGQVRDLREAASLSKDLAATLAGFAGETTRAGQLAQLDNLVTAWAASSGMDTSVEQAAAQGYRLIYLTPGLTVANYDALLSFFGTGSGDAGFDLSLFSDTELQNLQQLQAQQQAITKLIGTLEHFNGTTFVTVTADAVRTGAGQSFAVGSSHGGTTSSGGILAGGLLRVYVTLSAAQLTLLNNSFNSLKDSVYGGLITQTRLAPYFDAIGLVVTADGIALDLSDLDALLDSMKQTDAVNALYDMIELNRYGGSQLYALGWDGAARLRAWTEQASGDAGQQAVLAEMDVRLGSGSLAGSADADALFGQSGNDTLNGNIGDDLLDGGDGNDNLSGSNGNDVLSGGAGNDALSGGAGSDIYWFGRGSGVDTINNYDVNVGKLDVVQFAAGIPATDITVSRSGYNPVLRAIGRMRFVSQHILPMVLLPHVH